MVIFGASGDLTGRKLIPAIYNLAHAKLMPKQFGIVGVAIDQISDEDFRAEGPSQYDRGSQGAGRLLDVRPPG